jgi:hypothetical protein
MFSSLCTLDVLLIRRLTHTTVMRKQHSVYRHPRRENKRNAVQQNSKRKVFQIREEKNEDDNLQAYMLKLRLFIIVASQSLYPQPFYLILINSKTTTKTTKRVEIMSRSSKSFFFFFLT